MQKVNSLSCTQVIGIALDIGERMVQCGAEINRVEDTISRICHAYGIENVEVFSITSLIVVTASPGEANSVTQTRRIYNYTTSLGRLEQLNALSREICQTVPPADVVESRIELIYSQKRKIRWSSCIGYIMAGAGFAVFFGGTIIDALVTIPISIVQFFADSLISRQGANRIIYTVLISAVSGSMALLFTHFGIGDNIDKIMIGNIMPLIPGLLLTNSLREMFCGDTMSGFMRLLEALLLSAAIALGFAAPILIAGGLGL